MSDAHIVNIAWRTGGMAVLASMDEDGSDRLRESITAFARDGGAGYVSDTIVNLFGASDKPLSDTQVSQLGAALVDRWRE